jgi:hypothetical protein
VKRRSDKKRKLIIVGGLLLATLVLASAFLVGSGAVFTASSANPNSTWSAGTLSIDKNLPHGAIMTESNMKPKDVRTGSVVITNTGSIAGDFTLGMSNVVDTAGANGGKLSNTLQLLVTYTDGTGTHNVYSGPLKAFTGGNAGSIAANSSQTYNFTVTFPDGLTPPSDTTGDNAYQGSSMSADFNWTAVQH